MNRAFGTWKSPISSDMIVAENVNLSEVHIDGETIYWLEQRPYEAGRYAIIRETAEERREMIAAPWDSHSRVHEYGGSSYLVHEGVVYFTNFADQRIYRVTMDETPVPITPDDGARYAEMIFDAGHQRLIAVREVHRQGTEPQNQLVSIDPKQGTVEVLDAGHDFYANPQMSADGTQLAWVTWDLPQMPWDGSELWLATCNEQGNLVDKRLVAGGLNESVCQPKWSPGGQLYFISDRSGWWNLYRWHEGRSHAVHSMEAEFAAPAFYLGQSTYCLLSDQQLICAYNKQGRWRLGRLQLASGKWETIETPFTYLSHLQCTTRHAVCIAGSSTVPSAIVKVDLDTSAYETLHRSTSIKYDVADLSVPQELTFETTNQQIAHGFYYPPQHRSCRGLDGERPPLVVNTHGGPTAAATTLFNLDIQYWTSRGFAYFDVNYRGSTGYGRSYRQQLYGNWGISDVDDCISGARYLAQQGAVDANRMVIRGRSAGGFTALAALAFHDFFQAGASYFGVSDLERLHLETHKFESRYLEKLLGSYPEQKQIFLDRSPLYAAERFSSPVIFFQGELDRIVPTNQAEAMVERLRENGYPVSYVLFPGEGHGFLKATSLKRAMEGEFFFYSRIFGFQPADSLMSVNIDHLS